MKRRVVLVAHEGFQLLDLAGPADVVPRLPPHLRISPGDYRRRFHTKEC
ncbi:hypothetical protein [Nonomuraea sp. NPDC048826]